MFFWTLHHKNVLQYNPTRLCIKAMQNLITANFAIQFKAPHFNTTVMFKIALITIAMESMMHSYHEYNIRI